MNVLVISDSHIFKTPDGSYWCPTAVHSYEFWSRYLLVFDHVTVVSRVLVIKNLKPSRRYSRVDGPNLSILDLPFIRGAKGYIINYFKMINALKQLQTTADCAIFRLPSIPAFMFLKYFKKFKKPYAFEIIVDPENCYNDHWIVKKYYIWRLRKESLLANGVSYVTESYLENKYPCHAIKYGSDIKYFSSFYSSIDLDISFFYNLRYYEFVDYFTTKKQFHIVNVAASINSDEKGHSTLLKVIKYLVDHGLNAHLVCVGDGDKRSYYEKMAYTLGIDNNVKFVGLLATKEDIRDILLDSDLFLFPTKSEGLPRAIIEAQAVSLPCLSTNVDGIPELLPSEYLFNPLDYIGFGNKILQLCENPTELNHMAVTNYNIAHNYINSKLAIKRCDFYKKLKKLCY